MSVESTKSGSPVASHPTAFTPNSIEVSAGLVFRAGQLLITQRPVGGHLAGLWEFPGGKRERNETFEACLVRELREELGVEVCVHEELERITHKYPEKTVHLRFFRCTLVNPVAEPRALGCQAVAWVSRGTLANYAFPAADAHLLAKLAIPDFWLDTGSISSMGDRPATH
ncbi:MAG: (deoxy)nucleoside triphosphate pyrophosphohydrolase [Verrucomicrobia bacterium]|nr:(deoxy)nucleoside triphosphate pyrophosphohydrolase [Verrucomicrobiota bacterium]